MRTHSFKGILFTISIQKKLLSSCWTITLACTCIRIYTHWGLTDTPLEHTHWHTHTRTHTHTHTQAYPLRYADMWKVPLFGRKESVMSKETNVMVEDMIWAVSELPPQKWQLASRLTSSQSFNRSSLSHTHTHTHTHIHTLDKVSVLFLSGMLIRKW